MKAELNCAVKIIRVRVIPIFLFFPVSLLYSPSPFSSLLSFIDHI